MEPIAPITLLGYLNISLFLIFSVLGIYVLILIIKALKVYIKKNS